MTMKAIAILAMPGVQLLDVSGPLDVFAEANTQAGKPAYRLSVVGRNAHEVRSSSGIRIKPDMAIDEADNARFDTLLVAGCPNFADTRPDPAAVAWLRCIA